MNYDKKYFTVRHTASATLPTRKKQLGGTILGIIIGLIVGLSIAVVVALAINKGSPFANKIGNKPEKFAEPNAGQISDPNKPLQGGKDAAKEAAKDFAKEPAAAAIKAKDEESETAKPEPKPAVEGKAEARPDAKTLALADKEKKPDGKDALKDPAAKDPAAKASGLEEKWIYYLQAGAFRETTDAENTRARLALLGFEAAISERAGDNGVLYRVRMGPYNQVEAMNRTRSKLNENGVDVAVIRNPK